MTTDELKNLTADKVVDARGTACPGPLLAVKQAIGEVPDGGIMQIMSTDPVQKEMFPAGQRKKDMTTWEMLKRLDTLRCI